MEQLDIDDSSSPDAMALPDIDAPTSSYREARRLSIHKCIQSLGHACKCSNTSCVLQSCQKMKRVITHTKSCRRKVKGDCPICKQLIAVCCYHGKRCQETKCLVPFCSTIKQKLKNLYEEADEKPWHQSLSVGIRDYYARKLAIALSPNCINGSRSDGAIDYDAKKIEKDVFKKSCSRREYYHLVAEKIDNIEKALKTKKGQNHVHRQPAPSPQETILQVHHKALQQLMATLRWPPSRNQQQEILQILKSNPPLMAAFIKHRQVYRPSTSYITEV